MRGGLYPRWFRLYLIKSWPRKLPSSHYYLRSLSRTSGTLLLPRFSGPPRGSRRTFLAERERGGSLGDPLLLHRHHHHPDATTVLLFWILHATRWSCQPSDSSIRRVPRRVPVTCRNAAMENGRDKTSTLNSTRSLAHSRLVHSMIHWHSGNWLVLTLISHCMLSLV